MARLRVSLFVLCLVATMVGCGGARKNWVMLLSGANTYSNYSLQSMVFHTCQSLKKKGVPESLIVHMNYDDIAFAQQNPIKGNLVTLPNGTNWHPGCRVDYNSTEVTPELFLKVLSGDKEGVRRLLGRDGRVIDSGPDDHIFLYMADHGASQIFGFPSSQLDAKDLVNTLQNMHKNKRYAKMMLYMEACESGSMFDGLLPEDINLMAMTSANPKELAWACCWDDFRKAYVGGQWDNAWTYDLDKADITTYTFAEAYEVMKEGCSKNTSHVSHPSQYGDLSFNKMVLQEFQGPAPKQPKPEYKDAIPDVPHYLQFLPYARTDSSLMFGDVDLLYPPIDMLAIATPARQLLDETEPIKQKAIMQELQQTDDVRREADKFFDKLLTRAVGEAISKILREQTTISAENLSCVKSMRDLFTSGCAEMNPYKFAFVRRNFKRLTQLCNVLPEHKVAEHLTSTLRLTPFCNSANSL